MDSVNVRTRRWRTAARLLFLSVVGVTVVFPFYILMIEALHPNLVTMPYPVELWPSEIGLDNYALLFANYSIGRWTCNSLIISLGTSLLQAVLCSMAAFGFGRTHFRGRKQMLAALMLLLVIPIQTRILPLFIVFSEIKLLNTFWAWLPFFSDAFGIYLLMQCKPSPWILMKRHASTAQACGARIPASFCHRSGRPWSCLLPLTLSTSGMISCIP